MKKTIRIVSLMLVMVLLCGAMFSCSKATEKYADKINEAAEEDKHISLADVKDDLGDEALVSVAMGGGWIYAVKGCESKADVKALLEEGDTVEGIVIKIFDNKAISAEFREITNADLLLMGE